MDVPAAPTSVSRRTLRLIEALDRSRTSGNQAILAGPAAHDLFLDEDARALALPELLRSYCAARGLGLVSYRLETGPISHPTLSDNTSVEISTRRSDDEHPTTTIQLLLQDLRTAAVPAILVLDYADLLVPHDGPRDLATSVLVETLQSLAANAAHWNKLGLQLLLIDRGDGIMPRITSQPGFTSVPLEPPDAPETKLFLEQIARPGAKHTLYLSDDLSIERASRLSGGLLLRNLSELARTTSETSPLLAQTLSVLKGESIRRQSGGALDLLDDPVEFGSDVAGMPGLRLLIRDHLNWGRSDIRIALVGPPGTGKTYSARAIASQIGAPLVSFGQILGELLGQAENNMRRALSILRAMAPVVLFIDEADQGPLGARTAGGQTSNEAHLALRAMLFEFLGNPGASTGIHVVLTTNVPNHLDPRTRSRFQFVPSLFATGEELGQIMAIQARQASIDLAEDLSPLMVEFIDGGSVLSGRSVQELLKKSLTIAMRNGDPTVASHHAKQALAGWTGDDWDEKAEYSTLASLDMIKHDDELPWAAAKILGEDASVPPKLRQYVNADGTLRRTEISERLRRLDAAHVW